MEVDFLENGLPVALTAALSENPSLRVLSNRAAQHFEGDDELAVAIGRKLGVERLITGTFLRAENQVRRDGRSPCPPPTGSVEWSHTSQYAFENVLTLQDEICAGILANLRIPAESVAPET